MRGGCCGEGDSGSAQEYGEGVVVKVTPVPLRSKRRVL